MNIGQDQALRSIALTIPSSIRAEVNLLNMAFFLLSIQLLVRNSHLKWWTRPMRRDLIVKLLFVVAEPAQIGLQMVLAITTFTGLLHNCFRTRPCIIGRQGLRLVVTLRRLELTISGLRGQLPVHLEDRAI